MADQIHIDHEELRIHSDKLWMVADEIGNAAGEASGASLESDAFGRMMSWLPSVISGLVPTNAETIRSAGSVVESTARTVRALADDFRDTDEQIADALNGIRG